MDAGTVSEEQQRPTDPAHPVPEPPASFWRQVVFSTDSAPKSYTVTATVAGIGALTFKVVGL